MVRAGWITLVCGIVLAAGSVAYLRMQYDRGEIGANIGIGALSLLGFLIALIGIVLGVVGYAVRRSERRRGRAG